MTLLADRTFLDSFFKKLTDNFYLIVLVSAVFLSSSFVIGYLPNGRAIEIRLEDILIAVLVLFSAGLFFFKKIEARKPPFFYPILILLGFGFFTTLFNCIFGNLSIVLAFFYFLKEIELFLFYFYVFNLIRDVDSAKLIMGLIVILSLINSIFVVCQMFNIQILKGLQFWYGEYGTAALSEWGVFPTAAFFLLSFVFLFNIFLYYFLGLDINIFKKGILGLAVISPALGVFGAGSKTALLAFIFSFVSAILFLLIKKRNIKLIILVFIILVILYSLFSFAIKRVDILVRYGDIANFDNLLKNFKAARIDIMKENLDEAFSFNYPWFLFIGLGKGIFSEAHSQYVRNFIETGIIGSILFLVLIFYILRESFRQFIKNKDPLYIALSGSFLVLTLTVLFLSIATEVFIVVKPAELYWMFAGITMSVLAIKKK